MDALGELNDETPRIRISPDSPPTPEILFGLDTKLFEKSVSGEEAKYWDGVGAKAGWHGDEVETRTIWSGGREPGVGGVGGAKRKRGEGQGHQHGEGESCACEDVDAAVAKSSTDSGGAAETTEASAEVNPISREELDQALSKLNFEIYRGTSTRAGSMISPASSSNHLSQAPSDPLLDRIITSAPSPKPKTNHPLTLSQRPSPPL